MIISKKNGLYCLSIFILFNLVVFISSCTKDSKDSLEAIKATPCFNMSIDSIYIGQSVEIQDCSKNATAISYEIKGELFTVKDFPLEEFATKLSSFEGDVTITQKVSNVNGSFFTSQDLYIRPLEQYFYYPTETGKANVHSFGINPVLERMYAIVGANGGLFYVDISDELEFSLKEINMREGESSIRTGDQALCNFESNGILYFDIPTTTTSTVKKNKFWINPTTGESDEPISLVESSFNAKYITINNEKYAVGATTKSSNGTVLYAPVINRLNLGSTTKIIEYDFGDRSGILTNLIAYKNGYLASAVSFDITNSGLINITLLLLELDENHNLVETHQLTEVGELGAGTIGTFIDNIHLKTLPNNNILLYGQNEFRILSPDLTEVHKGDFSSAISGQEVLILEDGIILSEPQSLLKYDFSGNLLAQVDYGKTYVNGIVEYNGNILFMAEIGYNEDFNNPEFGGLFIGLMDKDMNLIPLN